MVKLFDKQQENKIINDYLNSKMNILQISKKYNCSKCTISRIFKKYNIKSDLSRKNITYKRKYKLNENFFDEINSHEKSYILGLFHSDGCNQPEKFSCKIVLKNSKDKSEENLLNNIKEIMEYEKPLILKNNTIRLSIYSKKISFKLKDLGVIKNKSLNLSFPIFLKEKYYNSFILGVFDGDGSIIKLKGKNKNLFSFNITGYKPFLEKISKIISEKCEVNNNKFIFDKRRNSNVGYISWCGKNNIEKIMNWLYKDCTA